MSSRDAASLSFVERHNLWSDEQQRRAREIEKQIETLDLVRFVFADQHGVLRGKTVVAVAGCKADAKRRLHDDDAARKGHLASHGVSGVHAGRRLRHAGDAGRRRFPDDRGPLDLPGAALGAEYRLGPVRHVFSRTASRCRSRRASFAAMRFRRLRGKGFDFLAGLEVEFHLYKIENPRLAPADATWPGEPVEVSYIHQGFQLLTEARSDQIEPVLEPFWRAVMALGMPLQSLEVELGPSQCEFTFRPELGHRRGRHDDAVSKRDEADRAPARPALHLHVPAGIAECVFLRLASASVADRREDRRQCFRVERSGRGAVAARPCAGSRVCSPMRKPRPLSPRRRSTATSATAPMRSRPTGRSGARTIAA